MRGQKATFVSVIHRCSCGKEPKGFWCNGLAQVLADLLGDKLQPFWVWLPLGFFILGEPASTVARSLSSICYAGQLVGCHNLTFPLFNFSKVTS